MTGPNRPIGVGSALRRARAISGISLDDAARDTKLRAEQLDALEEEAFDELGGEVYVRATLRTYAEYLGLQGDKVVAAYARHADDPAPPSPPAAMGAVERAIAATRVRDNQRFLLIAAMGILLCLVAVGMVSRRATPVPATLASAVQPVTDPAEGTIDVVLTATAQVEVAAIADGAPIAAVVLRPGEVVSFSASRELSVSASDGGLIGVSVAGRDLGAPGPAGEPWERTFGAADRSVP
jgi:hypothetical protein